MSLEDISKIEIPVPEALKYDQSKFFLSLNDQ